MPLYLRSLPRTLAPALLTGAIVTGALLTGACSSSSPSAAGTVTTPPATTPTTTTAPAATDPATTTPTATASATTPSAKDACALVTASLLKQTLGIDVPAGVSTAGATGGTTCTFTGASHSSVVIVQTSDQPDLYFPASLYADQNKPAAVPGADRGFVATPDSGNSHALIVKNGFGIDLTLYVRGGGLTIAKEQALAAAVLAQT